MGGSGADWLREGTSRATAAVPQFAEGDGPAWLTKQDGVSLEVISSGDTAAQVDPKRLCEFLLKQCQDRGVKLHQPARVVSVAKDIRDCLAAVRIVAQDGTETDRTFSRSRGPSGANDMNSSVYSSRDHSRSMVSSSLHQSLSFRKHQDSHLPSCRALACPQIAPLEQRA